MVHDDNTWPRVRPDLPAPLRYGRWSDVVLSEFQTAYEQAYRDQRPVEPHTPETWERLTASDSFATDLAALAITPDGQVAGFALGFVEDDGGIELGPIGTIPPWRRRGISSALLTSVLLRCRETPSSPSPSPSTVKAPPAPSTSTCNTVSRSPNASPRTNYD
jgi:GNAT superfamily N-acetyltransferase